MKTLLQYVRRISSRINWAIAGFWTIALIPFFLENASPIMSSFSSECHPDREEPGSMYQRVRSWTQKLDPFAPSPDNVVLVTYSARYEGRYLMGNYCVLRAFTARVLERLASVSPSAIAIDWSNDPTSCPSDDQGTGELKDAVRRVITGEVQDGKGHSFPAVPIIAARATFDKAEFERYAEDASHVNLQAMGEDDFIGQPDVLDGSGADFGLIRLDCESDRIPLRWNFYASPRDVGKPPKPADTMGLLAVRRSNHEAATRRPRLRKLMREDVNPYVSLFAEGEFQEVHAMDIVCNERPNEAAKFSGCKEGKQQELNKVRTKIALLADVSGREDFHRTPIGDVPGALLHANYIEYLINGQYTKPVSWALQLLISIGWFAAIEFIFSKYTRRPLNALLLSLAAIILGIFVFFFIAVRLLGYHLVLLPPSLLLICIRVCYALGERNAGPEA
jgi:hypothetical protein